MYKNFVCQHCHNVFEIHFPEKVKIVSCPKCHTVHDNHSKIIKIQNGEFHERILKIGNSGTIKNDTWKVLGYIEKATTSDFYNWYEYFLVNANGKEAWLIEENGHWSIYEEISKKSDPIIENLDTVYLKNQVFHKYQATYSIIKKIHGEFFWDYIRPDQKSKITDFISPPYVLSKDNTEDNNDWFRGEYLSRAQINQAFRIEVGKPTKEDYFLLPTVWSNSKLPILQTYYFFFFLFIFTQFYFNYQSENNLLVDQNSKYTTLKNNDITTNEFTISGKRKNVEIELQTNLENDWVEIDGEIINQANGNSYPFSLGNEYYTGTDYDGSWSEGENKSSTIISSIPSGSYKILYDIKGSNPNKGYGVNIIVRSDVNNISNLVLFLILLSIVPLIVLLMNMYKESSRWEESSL